MNTIIVIHGPQGCGKTRHAAALAAHFGAARIVDDWNGRDALQPGDLALTNCERGFKVSAVPGERRFVPFSRAVAEAGLAAA